MLQVQPARASQCKLQKDQHSVGGRMAGFRGSALETKPLPCSWAMDAKQLVTFAGAEFGCESETSRCGFGSSNITSD